MYLAKFGPNVVGPNDEGPNGLEPNDGFPTLGRVVTFGRFNCIIHLYDKCLKINTGINFKNRYQFFTLKPVSIPVFKTGVPALVATSLNTTYL